MAQGPIDPDQFTAPFQLTKGMYRDVYPAVDPKSEGLKATGKVVVITGAGGGLGYVGHLPPHVFFFFVFFDSLDTYHAFWQATAQAWSLAGAAGICLAGRTASTLESTAKSLQVPSLVVTGDIVSESDTKAIIDQTVEKFGKVDVLINAAGSMNAGAMTGEVEPSQWFYDFVSSPPAPPPPFIGWEEANKKRSSVSFKTDRTGIRKPMSKGPTTCATTSSKLLKAREPLSTWCHWAPLFYSRACHLTLPASSRPSNWASSSI